ncbi:MAG: helix-turn-helix domain-containing protein [Thermodesulfobacteriota bacterium]
MVEWRRGGFAVAKVGEVLRQTRESRSLSLDEVRSALGIPMHYLQAMESGSTSLVADEFYLIPFLRRYAEYLELDPASTVAQFLGEAAREEARAPEPSALGAGGRGSWLVGGIVGVAVVAVALWFLFSAS